MGCAPSKGSTIAVQPAVTPRAGPATRQANPPPVTPPLTVSNNRNKSNNPLDEKRPLPAIGGLSSEASGRRPSSLTTVPEHEEGSLSQRLPKLDVNAMAKDARESEGSKDVKHTQSSVAFTFDFGDSSAEIKPAGRLPPLIREKTIRKSTEAGELKSTLERRQQEADDRRQNELNSIASKKKRRKVKLKSAKVNNFSSQQSVDSATDVVPPLEISTSPDKNGSPTSDATIPRNGAQQNTTSTPLGTTVAAEVEPRKGSAYHDSTYGSDDEIGADTNNRVVDPLRRLSKKRGMPNSTSNKAEDDGFYGKSDEIENINPMEAAQFFDDSTEQM